MMCKYPKCAVLDLKECIEIFQVVCLESYYSKTFNQMHANTSFRNGSGASTKWRETFENLSFGPKVVDWACLLQKKHEMVLVEQTRALNVPRYRFLQHVKCGYEMAWNHTKHEF